MGLKKHRLKINIESSTTPSGYVVDLRSNKSINPSITDEQTITEKKVAPAAILEAESQTVELDSLLNKISNDKSRAAADDFLRASRAKAFSFLKLASKNSCRLAAEFDFSDIKETLFYPLFLGFFKAAKKLLILFSRPIVKIGQYFSGFNLWRRSVTRVKNFFINVYEISYHGQRVLISGGKYLFGKFYKRVDKLLTPKDKPLFAPAVLKIEKPEPARMAENSRPPVWSTIDYFKKLNAENPISDKEIEAHPVPRRNWKSFLFFFLLLFFLAAAFKLISYRELFNPQAFKQRVMNSVSAAAGNFFSASSAVSGFDFAKANTDFATAGANFLRAQEDIKKVDDGLLKLASLSRDEHWRLASISPQILSAGQAAAVLGEDLSLAADSLSASSTLSIAPIIGTTVINPSLASGTRLTLSDDSSLSDSATSTSPSIGPMLEKFAFYIRQAAQDSLILKEKLEAIDKNRLPEQYQEQFTVVYEQVKVLSAGLQEFTGFADVLQEFLGVSRDRRYLLIFQNNNEIRASGGFIGSYALADVREGRLRNLEMPAGGSYDTEGGMRVLMAAPQPLWLVNPLWHFWDANWWPDWPTSAKNLMWFYEKSDGPTVDGVLSFTPTVLEDILRIIGPVDMTEDYGVIVDADNFWITTQDIIERTGNPEIFEKEGVASIQASITSEKNQPKKILGDLTNKILSELPARMNKEMAVKLLGVMEQSLRNKQILLYFNNDSLQSKIALHNWAGGQDSKTPGDYLMVVNTNIAGQKTDRVMSQFVSHSAEVLVDGSIIDNVKIERVHTGKKGDLYTGVRNVDWLRLYVPAGSTLISANGFSSPDAKYFEAPDSAWQVNEFLSVSENRAVIDPLSGVKIYNENGRTVFANWVMTDPGQSSVLNFSYKLPFKIQDLKASTWKSIDSQPKSLWERFLLAFDRRFNSPRPDNWFYSLLVQKQPGAKNNSIISELKLPDNFQVLWSYPETLLSAGGYKTEELLDGDRRWIVIIKNPSGPQLQK